MDVFASCILDSVSEGVFTVDSNMLITSFNHAAEEITGFRRTEVIGRKCSEIFRGNLCTNNCPVREALRTGQAVRNNDVEIATRDNRRIPIGIAASILRDASGTVVGAVESFRDLSLIFSLQKEIQKNYMFCDLVSRNPVMRGLFEILPDIATTEATVFIHGESGTGKELFARALHKLSSRKNGPLVIVNCGALPEPLLEAEIFGARRGAYTGAVENRLGRMDQAQGGTLFLDEIGDLPLPLQVKLLRVLENREYQALGAQKPQKANVRFIAATNCDLEAMVEAGTFRRDLFFRVNVVALHIPPLREHKEDIPVLMDFALAKFNHKYTKRIQRFSPEVQQILLDYNYPGNVRELLNIVEQAVIFCKGEEIGTKHLPHAFILTKESFETCIKPARQCPNRETLSEALLRNKGNRSRTAHEFGIERTTLWRWMKRRGLTNENWW